MATIFSYWLLPAQPAAAAFATQIRALAQRYDAVVFEPHMTLQNAASDDAEVADMLAYLRPSFRPLSVRPFVIAQSSRLTKTLYVRLELAPELTDLSETIRRRSRQPSGFVLEDPHVSLMYQRIDEAERARLAAEIPLPAPFIADGIAVIETETPLETLDAIRRWRFVNRFRHGE